MCESLPVDLQNADSAKHFHLLKQCSIMTYKFKKKTFTAMKLGDKNSHCAEKWKRITFALKLRRMFLDTSIVIHIT